MPVDIFGRTPTASSQRVNIGVASTQATIAFLVRDGGNTVTSDMNLDSHEIIIVLNPTSDQVAAIKEFATVCSSKLKLLRRCCYYYWVFVA